MKVRIKATSNITNVPRNETTQILLESGLIELVNDPPPTVGPPKSVWKIGAAQSDGEQMLVARCATCGKTEVAFGPVNEKNFSFVHCGVQEYPPSDVIALYRAGR